MSQDIQEIDPLEDSPVRLDTWYDLFFDALKDPHSYNPASNIFLWIGFIWGIPIPLLFLWYYDRIRPNGPLDVWYEQPLYVFFMAHPLLFAFVFGLAGSVIHHYVRRLRDESIRDYLTGLYNHRFFRKELNRRIDEAERYDLGFCLILFDLDHFKRVNDQYGHQTGDQVLEKFADLLQDLSRESDAVFRYGGEEFAIILPETSIDEASNLAERIRERVSKYDFGIDRQITISGGVAEFPSDSTDESDLIQKVDERLYRAKDRGRNRIQINGSP